MGFIRRCAVGLILLGCGPVAKKELPDDIDPIIQDGAKTANEVPASCRPTDARAVQLLYDLTEDSVHELITCGGIQMELALSMKLMIFSSNEQLVSASARADLHQAARAVGMSLENPFTRDTAGSWVMNAGGSDGSTFSLEFYDPTTGAKVSDNPFDLNSYLIGVTASSSQTWDQMKANPTSKTTFTYQWTELGPLSHLLADGGDISNPIVIRMSLLELGGAALGVSKADYGPFESVQNLQMESKIHMIDGRSPAAIAYDVTGRRDSVRNVVEAGSLQFDVDSMASTDGSYRLVGNTGGLAFLGIGELAGEIRYTASGNGINLIVTSDFGAGAAYPVPRWECR